MTLPLGIETQLRNQAVVLTQGKAPSDLLAEGKSIQRGRAVTSVGVWGEAGEGQHWSEVSASDRLPEGREPRGPRRFGQSSSSGLGLAALSPRRTPSLSPQPPPLGQDGHFSQCFLKLFLYTPVGSQAASDGTRGTVTPTAASAGTSTQSVPTKESAAHP